MFQQLSRATGALLRTVLLGTAGLIAMTSTVVQALPIAGDEPAAAGARASLAGLPSFAQTVQRDGVSLSEAVESVRRRGDVERVISAETQVSNGREVHHIRVMTRDGKVKTYKVNGRRQG